jgi:hypothetical protein
MRGAEFRQGRLADCLQGGREDLQLARRCAEALLLVFVISSFERHANDSARRVPQHRRANPTRREVMSQRRFDISVPEIISETEANRQIEHHINVSASFAAALLMALIVLPSGCAGINETTHFTRPETSAAQEQMDKDKCYL